MRLGEKETLESTLKFFEDRFERLSDLEFYQVRHLQRGDTGSPLYRALAFVWHTVCNLVYVFLKYVQDPGWFILIARTCWTSCLLGVGCIHSRGLCHAVQERRLKRLGLLDDDGKSTYDGRPHHVSVPTCQK